MSILGRDTCQSAAICIYAVRAVAVNEQLNERGLSKLLNKTVSSVVGHATACLITDFDATMEITVVKQRPRQ